MDIKLYSNMFKEFKIPDVKEWESMVQKTLKEGLTYKNLIKRTYEGIDLKPVYTKADINNLSFIHDLPGEGSFVRGTNFEGNKTHSWKVNQEILGSSPEQLNKKIKHSLNYGQSMIHLNFSENPNDVLTYSVNDLITMLKDLSIKDVPIFIQAGEVGIPILFQYIAYVEQTKNKVENLTSFIGIAPLNTLIEKGTLPISIDRNFNILKQLIEWLEEKNSNIRTVHIKSTSFHNAGCNAVEELAFTLSMAVEYINKLLDKGLQIDQIAKNIYFTFSIGSNFFMEIAKLRATRLLWSKIIKAYGGSIESQKIMIHGQTSQWTKAQYDSYVNILRATTESFAGAISGVESLHVSPFDEVLRPPTEFSQRIARNTQIILQEESHVNKVIDPAGGSWYIETLTDQVAEKAWKLFQSVQEEDGFLACLKAGKIQKQVTETANKKMSNVNERKDRIVGVNMYANLDESILDQKVYEKNEPIILNQHMTNSFDKNLGIDKVMDRTENMFKHLIKVAKEGETVSQLMDLLIDKGEEKIKPLVSFRNSESFEKLRVKAELYKKKNGKLPQVFFVNIGPIPKHKARSDFSKGFFSAGGFEAKETECNQTIEEVIHSIMTLEYSIVVINGSDDQYLEFVPKFATALKNKTTEVTLFLAGKQLDEIEKKFTQCGVDEYIHRKSNCYEVLSKLLDKKGV